MGDEYRYRTRDGVVVSTQGHRAEIEKALDTPRRRGVRVTHRMKIPAALPAGSARTTAQAAGEGHRVGESVLTGVRAEYTLRPGSDRLEVKTVIDNTAENHRLVVLTKNDIHTDMALAEGQFNIIARPIQPWPGWENPTKPGKMTAFFGLEDETKGLLIATRGLCEYEVLRDGANTMSLTLHRGVDRLGDWGVFPTPEAQCKGTLTVEYAYAPFAAAKAGPPAGGEPAYAFAAGQPRPSAARPTQARTQPPARWLA